MKFFNYKNKSSGYALLFTMVIVTVIMVIATGIYSSISKQLVLSSTARESQIAFYEADTAGECMLYASQVKTLMLLFNTTPRFACGGVDLDITNPSSGVYRIDPDPTTTGPAFKIEVDESIVPSVGKAYGYNLWQDNKRKVERGIEITY
jgi:hypothetical protein